MNQEITELLNEQINQEFFSAYLYLDMANYYVAENLDGFANWFQIQAQEERDHAMLFVQYMRDNDACIELKEIREPKEKLSSAEVPLEIAYSHEKSVTASIHVIYDKALQAKDFRTMQFLNWFVKEQNEEEKVVKSLCDKMSLIGGKKQGLYMLDNELKARAYIPPVITE